MFTRDVLIDGSTRLICGECGFLFSRLAPGIVLTRIRGADTGNLGFAPLDEIKAEFERFGVPVTWFIDAEETALVRKLVSEQWTAWLSKNSSLLNAIHVFSTDKKLHLTIEVAKHFSKTTRVMNNHRERSQFEKALFKTVGKGLSPRPDWFTEREIPIRKFRERDRTTRIENEFTSFTFIRLRENVVWSTINGIENGSLSNAPFDHMLDELKKSSRRLNWLVDCSQVSKIDSLILESWIQWTVRHQAQLEAVHMFVPEGVIPILIDIAQLRSNNKRIHLYRNRDVFSRVCEQSTLSRESVS